MRYVMTVYYIITQGYIICGVIVNTEPIELTPLPVERLDGFLMCKALGYDVEDIKKAYGANDGKCSRYLFAS